MNDVTSTASVRRSPDINEFAEALASAQGEFQPVEKKRTARVKGKTKDGKPYDYSYKYADLGDVLTSALPILSKHGLAFSQPTVIEGGVIYIRTTLMHKSGQWQESDYPVAAFGQMKHQQIGEALTYAKRYAGCAALGIAPEETVENGEDAGGDVEVGKPQTSPRQQRREAPEIVIGGQDKRLPPLVGDADPKIVAAWSSSFVAALDKAQSASEIDELQSANSEALMSAPEEMRQDLIDHIEKRKAQLEA